MFTLLLAPLVIWAIFISIGNIIKFITFKPEIKPIELPKNFNKLTKTEQYIILLDLVYGTDELKVKSVLPPETRCNIDKKTKGETNGIN
jgi:hypothetical protein